MAIKRQFFDLYILQELPKIDIKTTLNLTEKAYTTLVKLAKSWDEQTLTTDFLERITARRLLVDPRDNEAIKTATEIWKSKSKIKETPKDEAIPQGVMADSLNVNAP